MIIKKEEYERLIRENQELRDKVWSLRHESITKLEDQIRDLYNIIEETMCEDYIVRARRVLRRW